MGEQGEDEVRDSVTFAYDPDRTDDLNLVCTPGPGVRQEWIDSVRWKCFLHDLKDDLWYGVPRQVGEWGDDVSTVWDLEPVPVILLNDPIEEVFLSV